MKGPASPRDASGLLWSLQQASQQLLQDHHHFSKKLPSVEIQIDVLVESDLNTCICISQSLQSSQYIASANSCLLSTFVSLVVLLADTGLPTAEEGWSGSDACAMSSRQRSAAYSLYNFDQLRSNTILSLSLGYILSVQPAHKDPTSKKWSELRWKETKGLTLIFLNLQLAREQSISCPLNLENHLHDDRWLVLSAHFPNNIISQQKPI